MKPKPTVKNGKKCYVLDARAKGLGRIFGKDKEECWQKFDRENAGVAQIEFNDSDRLAKVELAERGTLLQAVRVFLASLDDLGHKRTEKLLVDQTGADGVIVPGAISEWLAEMTRNKACAGYRATGACAMRHFVRFLSNKMPETQMLVSRVTPALVRQFLAMEGQWSDGYRNSLRGRLVNFFTFCCQEENMYCVTHPIKGGKVRGVRKNRDDAQQWLPPAIFTVPQCRVLLDVAQEKYPALLPYLALGLFCGLRPDVRSEMGRIKPGDINLASGIVHVIGKRGPRHVRLVQTVKTTVAKLDGGTTEHIETFAPALEWLKVAPSLAININRRMRKGLCNDPRCKAVGISWSPDVMRHTFASFHYYGFKSSTDTAEEMGHDQSMKMLRTHYLNRAAEPLAMEFWRLTPKPIVQVLPAVVGQ